MPGPPSNGTRDAAIDVEEEFVLIPAGAAHLEGDLVLPEGALGVVLFAHGSGSDRHSPRNRYIAEKLNDAGIGTLLVDLETFDEAVAGVPINFEVLRARVEAVTAWLASDPRTSGLSVGYFGGSTGAAVALMAAAWPGSRVRAVVSRGGRTDLAGAALEHVQAPTLLVVGGRDYPVLGINRRAYSWLSSPEKDLAIVPGASHLFEETGALEAVARLAIDWFKRHLTAQAKRSQASPGPGRLTSGRGTFTVQGLEPATSPHPTLRS